VVVGLDALITIVAGTLLLAPFSVAITVKVTVLAVFPAVNVVEEAVVDERLPSLLLIVQV
jgi:hypothetical protein